MTYKSKPYGSHASSALASGTEMPAMFHVVTNKDKVSETSPTNPVGTMAGLALGGGAEALSITEALRTAACDGPLEWSAPAADDGDAAAEGSERSSISLKLVVNGPVRGPPPFFGDGDGMLLPLGVVGALPLGVVGAPLANVFGTRLGDDVEPVGDGGTSGSSEALLEKLAAELERDRRRALCTASLVWPPRRVHQHHAAYSIF